MASNYSSIPLESDDEFEDLEELGELGDYKINDCMVKSLMFTNFLTKTELSEKQISLLYEAFKIEHYNEIDVNFICLYKC